MKYLLDTHVFLWAIEDDPQLSPRVIKIIDDVDSHLILSIASLWEIAIKLSLGKLELKKTYKELIPDILIKYDIEQLPIHEKHIEGIVELPFHHKDPFDRMILSQSLILDIPLISIDTIFDKYEVNRIW